MDNNQFDDRYTGYQLHRGWLRTRIRSLYLRSARAGLSGATLDFGCGVGGLPPGSMGLEYNRATVAHCVARDLEVAWYDGYADDWRLTGLPPGRRFESMVISHVLEHLDDPMAVLRRLLAAAHRIGVRNVLVIVPGRAGFRIDDTHRTFVDRDMLNRPDVVDGTPFRVISSRFFPGDRRVIGDLFPHHELQVSYASDPSIRS